LFSIDERITWNKYFTCTRLYWEKGEVLQFI